MSSFNMFDEVRRLSASSLGVGFVLAGLGFVTWASISLWGGLTHPDLAFRSREAWDLPAYFYVGLPVMALAVGAAGFLHPERLWRWPLWLVIGHQVGVLLFGLGMQSGVSLLILALVLGVLLATGFAVPALIGSAAAKRLAPRAS